ncbi:hypothetical protein [Hellea balneolensis]|uniref:hypothetical protein n=1 Tax=Hellea balneolensis TaxID=287478 RepID=UPI000478BCBA|nr:hypothetical protein [Hellea balneolensis]
MTKLKSIKTAAILLASTTLAPSAFAGGQAHSGYTPDLLPPSSNAGECYARVEVPAQYSAGSEQIMVEEGYSTVEVAQPTLAQRQENVMVKEASVRYRVTQPSYRSVTEQMLVRPAYDKLTVSAPQFSTVIETIQTSAPRLVWKRGNPGKLAAQGYTIHSTADGGRFGQGYSNTEQYLAGGGDKCGPTCEIWCLVEEPGEQVQFNRKVMTSPGQVRRQSVPAKYKTIHKQVVSNPGGVEEIPVPAEYRAVMVEDVVDPGGERVVNVPPKFAEVATKTLVTPSRYEWRRVLCAPGTGSIKSSADYAAPSSSYGTGGTHYSSGSTGGYTSGTHSSSTSYSSGHSPVHTSNHTSGQTHHYGTHTAPGGTVAGSRVVTGSGYYGGYEDKNATHHSSGSHSDYEYRQKAKRKRKTWH